MLSPTMIWHWSHIESFLPHHSHAGSIILVALVVLALIVWRNRQRQYKHVIPPPTEVVYENSPALAVADTTPTNATTSQPSIALLVPAVRIDDEDVDSDEDGHAASKPLVAVPNIPVAVSSRMYLPGVSVEHPPAHAAGAPGDGSVGPPVLGGKDLPVPSPSLAHSPSVASGSSGHTQRGPIAPAQPVSSAPAQPVSSAPAQPVSTGSAVVTCV